MCEITSVWLRKQRNEMDSLIAFLLRSFHIPLGLTTTKTNLNKIVKLKFRKRNLMKIKFIDLTQDKKRIVKPCWDLPLLLLLLLTHSYCQYSASSFGITNLQSCCYVNAIPMFEKNFQNDHQSQYCRVQLVFLTSNCEKLAKLSQFMLKNLCMDDNRYFKTKEPIQLTKQ